MIDRLPQWVLRAEGLGLFVGAVVLYFHFDYPWWLLLVLALAPDLSMLIWLAHIGADRALGYGLKYPTHFKDTHLQRV